jgi:hypothetical protein
MSFRFIKWNFVTLSILFMMSQFMIGLFLFPLVSFAATDAKISLETLLQKQFPGAKSLLQTDCELGSTKVKSAGILIQKVSAKDKHPLAPLIAYMEKDQWVLIEMPKKLEYSKGSAQDFLFDFWSPKTNGLKGKYEIRCANPDVDKDISTSANGEFSKNFRDKKSGKHLCFQADTAYNSWACFNFNPDLKKIESSFSQMNAD